MTEELISTLSKIGDLEVIARTSVIQYRDATKDVATIGRELEAGTVLEGSVRRAGDRLRITVQLIDTASQAHLWSEDYDRDLEDVFAIQTEIARQVADALEVRLLGGVERLARPPTDDLAAYQLYLLGRHDWNQRNDEGIRKAIGYAALPPRDALSKARTAARKALELDETLAEAHTSLALTRMLYDWDWAAAERGFRRALKLNPSLARAHQWYAWYFLGRRRYEDSLRQFRRALELDPLSVVLNTEAGWPYNYMDEPDPAIEQYRKALALDPDFALDWLEKACRDREPLFLFWLDTRFLPFESVRRDPRFTALLEEIGVPT